MPAACNRSTLTRKSLPPLQVHLTVRLGRVQQVRKPLTNTEFHKKLSPEVADGSELRFFNQFAVIQIPRSFDVAICLRCPGRPNDIDRPKCSTILLTGSGHANVSQMKYSSSPSSSIFRNLRLDIGARVLIVVCQCCTMVAIVPL